MERRLLIIRKYASMGIVTIKSKKELIVIMGVIGCANSTLYSEKFASNIKVAKRTNQTQL
ncbi:hypothetical protein J19TS1_33940 [Heyndrickxia oleronia]|nr:hypothetical protein J19TS1_33940 [Heyndrickxia oleronia]